MLPEVGRSSVPISATSVDFPEPFGPVRIVIDPCSKRHDTPTTARTAPYVLLTVRTSTAPRIGGIVPPRPRVGKRALSFVACLAPLMCGGTRTGCAVLVWG